MVIYKYNQPFFSPFKHKQICLSFDRSSYSRVLIKITSQCLIIVTASHGLLVYTLFTLCPTLLGQTGCYDWDIPNKCCQLGSYTVPPGWQTMQHLPSYIHRPLQILISICHECVQGFTVNQLRSDKGLDNYLY